MNKEKQLSNFLFLFAFSGIILALGIGIFVLPQQSFSEKENRTLSDAPKISASAISDGSFFAEVNAFYSDHIPFRNSFTAIHAISELSMGKAQSNGVIPTKSGALVPTKKYSFENSVEEIYKLQTDRKDLYFYVAPRVIDVFEDSLPSIVDTKSHKKVLEVFEGDTLYELEKFVEQGDAAYYKTDHHWTTDGAFFAYRQICENMEIIPIDESCFEKDTVSTSFYGTSFAKSGLPYFAVKADTITLYRYNSDQAFVIQNHETGETKNGFYDLDALNTADKYRVFLGGNYSHISITENNTAEKEKLLLIKDSYANSVIPFLAIHFDIEVIDPRYCTRSFVVEKLNDKSFDKTLILMGVDSLVN